jgi:murein DD-endopeptidase MepM/ murein hydrolase activator NlpD
MLSSLRTRAPGCPGFIARILTIALAAAAAGCSSEVTRFSYNGNATTGSIPVPEEPIGRGAPPRGLGITEAPLPPPSPSSGYGPASNTWGSNHGGNPYPPPQPYAGQPSAVDAKGNYRVVGRSYKSQPASYTEPQPAPLPPPRPQYQQQYQQPQFHQPQHQQPAAPVSGDWVEVQPGETLYGIAQRHGVHVAAIKELNGLSSDHVRPGQRLMLPGEPHARAPFSPPHSKAQPAEERVAKSVPPPPGPQAAEPPPGWVRYVLKNGESLYGLALRHRVGLDELKRVNGITDPTKVWAGTAVFVPAESAPAISHAPQAQPQGGVPRVVQVPRVINAAPEPAQATPTPAQPSAGGAAAKFRWPVRGRVISTFGKRPDGSHNDGVNVAVPQGTEITAAAAGKVAYAGNELKGYGNLVLIRHDDGWVSAYAHADQILVRPNDEVRRGQVIARAGKTGAVDQPQLHFELRRDSRPVDPMPYLAN